MGSRRGDRSLRLPVAVALIGRIFALFKKMRHFALLPAAGRSKRMGQPKLLLPWGASTVIETVLAAWGASVVARVIVVVHPQDQELADVCRRARADVVVPTVAPAEMRVSIRLGLEHIAATFHPTSADAWLLAPADMPLLTTAAIDAVVAAHNPQSPHILVPTHHGRRGHPVLFPWPLAQEVFTLADDEGVNAIVHRHGYRSVELADAAAIGSDIDTPADYDRLRPR